VHGGILPGQEGLGQVGILLVQGSIPESLRDFGNPAVDIHVERLRFPGLILRLYFEGSLAGEEAGTSGSGLMSQQFN
jgi:hypothetical protein